MPFLTPSLLVGVSARIYYPATPVLDLGGVWTKTLHYMEQSVAQMLMRCGALPVMVPAVDERSLVRPTELNLSNYAESLDALVLQGGNDVAPESYGETPINAHCRGDPVRDQYEIALIHAFAKAGKPVFGICRGLQILNVAFGGTLWQDIETQVPDALDHVRRDIYDQNAHEIELKTGTRLQALYPHASHGRVNSIHHQAIKQVAPGFVVEAVCPDDGIVEAIRREGDTYIAGVQWHPEFHAPDGKTHLDDQRIVMDFLRTARRLKIARAPEPLAPF
jgi:putative glutamine amidotransferase